MIRACRPPQTCIKLCNASASASCVLCLVLERPHTLLLVCVYSSQTHPSPPVEAVKGRPGLYFKPKTTQNIGHEKEMITRAGSKASQPGDRSQGRRLSAGKVGHLGKPSRMNWQSLWAYGRPKRFSHSALPCFGVLTPTMAETDGAKTGAHMHGPTPARERVKCSALPNWQIPSATMPYSAGTSC